jgi:hypothetical protein
MKARGTGTSYGMQSHMAHHKAHKKTAKKHHAVKAHTRRIPYAKMFNIPDEQMSEPPVVPREVRRYWH